MPSPFLFIRMNFKFNESSPSQHPGYPSLNPAQVRLSQIRISNHFPNRNTRRSYFHHSGYRDREKYSGGMLSLKGIMLYDS